MQSQSYKCIVELRAKAWKIKAHKLCSNFLLALEYFQRCQADPDAGLVVTRCHWHLHSSESKLVSNRHQNIDSHISNGCHKAVCSRVIP